jgi:hypothetical protein
MADSSKSPIEFLKQKVGPLPLFVWLGAGGAIWWYLQTKQSATTSASQAANLQTDPAGNIGTIDPATGYVYGTPEDLAALAANNAGTSSSTTGASSSATTGAQTYADNNAWGEAAISYLVGLGIDGTTANQAVENYLTSQPLTSAQQGDVNLAITALGPPPTLPGPVSTNPTPVATNTGSSSGGTTTTSSSTPTGTTTSSSTSTASATPTLSGGHVVSVTNNTAVIAWTMTGTSTAKVTISGPGKIDGQSNTVTIPQATYSGLEAGHTYDVTVQPLVNGQPAGKSGVITIKTTT